MRRPVVMPQPATGRRRHGDGVHEDSQRDPPAPGNDPHTGPARSHTDSTRGGLKALVEAEAGRGGSSSLLAIAFISHPLQQAER
jgi:hypothetical protein